MVTNVFFATTILFMAAGFFLLDQCRFLIPYKALLMERYGAQILLFAAVLFIIFMPPSTSASANFCSRKQAASWPTLKSSFAQARVFPKS